jgi:hypothetical protein
LVGDCGKASPVIYHIERQVASCQANLSVDIESRHAQAAQTVIQPDLKGISGAAHRLRFGGLQKARPIKERYMRNPLFLTLLAAVCSLLFIVTNVSAQDDLPKAEVGAFLTVPKLGNPLQSKPLGVGGRFSYNLTNYLALDTEGAYYPYDVESFGQAHGFFGVKVGKRFGPVGLFVKVRPGLFRDYVARLDRSHQNFFALDAGGVLECYPGQHFLFRLDCGNTTVAYNGVTISYGQGARQVKTSSSVQASVGFGVRF